jgi:hypothetical protein
VKRFETARKIALHSYSPEPATQGFHDVIYFPQPMLYKPQSAHRYHRVPCRMRSFQVIHMEIPGIRRNG